MNVPVYDADSRAKDLMTTDGILMSQIKKEFGELSFNSDGSLNRRYLSERVFHNPERLSKLNSLVHPRVAIDYQNWVNAQGHCKYVIKEAALLFEAASYKSLDKIIVVHAPEPLRVTRVLKRDPGRTERELHDIMARQMPEEEKLKRADFIIYNDETRLLIPQVLELDSQFRKMN